MSGEIPGVALKMNSLLIINGIISELIQAAYYPEFAMQVSCFVPWLFKLDVC